MSAKIVCCTLNCCSNPTNILKNYFQNAKDDIGCKPEFAACIIDEAASVTEMESLAPLVFNFKKLVLVGDPMLKGAKVLSKKCQLKKYGDSLFHRLYDHYSQQEPSPVIALKELYRTHEEILKWSNEQFYEGKLTKPVRVREAKNFVNLENLLSPYLFCNYTISESSKNGDMSPDDECHMVIEVLKSIWAETITIDQRFSIGVIIPHTNEKKKMDLVNKIRVKLPEVYNCIEVANLEQFQGKEKDVIVFPCFRSQEVEVISGNKLNLALTRAIQSLTIIGNADYLKTIGIWKKLVEDAESRKLVQNIPVDKIKQPQFITGRLRSCFRSRRTSEIPEERRLPNRLDN